MTNDPKLLMLKRRAHLFDIFFCALTILLLLSLIASIFFFWPWHAKYSIATRSVSSLFMGMILFYPLIKALSGVNEIAASRWFRSYYVSDDGEILRVHGPIPLTQWRQVANSLLAQRPGYKLADPSTYNCTMVAVPR